MDTFDTQYYELLLHLVNVAEEKPSSRPGMKTKSTFGHSMSVDLSDSFPLTTLRKTPLRWIFEETMMFVRGESQTKVLEETGITIWKGNSSREFLDNKGHTDWPEGEIGPGSYGALWRAFPGKDGKTVDQLKQLVDGLKNNPYDRRHLISAWHPQYSVDFAALPACHILQQYDVTPSGKLNSNFYMRSNDVLFGLPFNMAQYAFMNICIAKLVGLEPGKLTYMCGDSHIYENQYAASEYLLLQTEQMDIPPPPKLEITKELNTLDDFVDLKYTDLQLTGYNPNPDIPNKPKMAV